MQILSGKVFADIFEQEVPSGTVNGVTTAFTLSAVPAKSKAVILMLNGIVQRQTADYSVSGTAITMVTAPATGEKIYCFYIKK